MEKKIPAVLKVPLTAIDTNGNFNGIFRYMKNKYKFEMKRVKSTAEQ